MRESQEMIFRNKVGSNHIGLLINHNTEFGLYSKYNRKASVQEVA